MQYQTGIHTCQHIIEHDAKATRNMFVQIADAQGFKDIEKPEQNKSNQDIGPCEWDKQHGNQQSHKFVNHNFGRVFVIP